MRIRVLVIALLCLAAARSFALDSKTLLDHAIEQADAHRYSLARAYLDPVVIDPREPVDKRAHAYYIRGYCFFAEGFYVSAARDYENALNLAPDNPGALAELGHLYADGLGVDKSPERAFRLLQKAARAAARKPSSTSATRGSPAKEPPPTRPKPAIGCAKRWLPDASRL